MEALAALQNNFQLTNTNYIMIINNKEYHFNPITPEEKRNINIWKMWDTLHEEKATYTYFFVRSEGITKGFVRSNISNQILQFR